jgi:hypothetical protein
LGESGQIMAVTPQSGNRRKDAPVAYTGLFHLREWIWLGPLAVLGVGLGVWGFMACDHCEPASLVERIVKSIALVRGNMPYSYGKEPIQLVIAQFLLPGLALFGGFKLVLHNVRRDVRVAMARRQKNHTIVCGLDDSGRQIVENLRAAGGPVVAIALNEEDANAIACERLGVAVLKGDATQLGMLILAGLRRADTVVITCGSDTINLEVALHVGAALTDDGRTRPLLVLPEVRSAWLLELLRAHPTANLSKGVVETRPFDLTANAARFLLQDPAFGRMWRVAAAATDAQPLQPHLLVAGLGELGMDIIVQAVQTTFALPDCKLAVTVLDQHGEESAAVLDARYPGLHELIDREFVSATFEADNPAGWPAMWSAVETALEERPASWMTLAVVVTLKEDKDALHTAMQLRERLDKMGAAGTPVFVRVRQQYSLGQFAASLDGSHSLLNRVIPFGDLGVLTSPELLIDETQDRLAHGVHASYLAGDQGVAPTGEAAVPWAQLAERFKQSNRASADHIAVKLGYAGMRLIAGAGPEIVLTEDEIEAMSAAEHRRWMIEHKAAGWTFGEERDDVARRHPLLVPWSELPERARAGNRAAVRHIPAGVAAASMIIRREQIIGAFGDRLAEADIALDAIPHDEQAIVIFDPHEKLSWQFAQTAAQRGAKLWVLWHEGSHAPLVAPTPPSEALRAAVELAVSASEAAAMLPMPQSETVA